MMLTPTSEEFEYCCIEWRNFDKENIQEKIDDLLAKGWELDGSERVKAGMFVDLYWQQFRKPKERA